MRPFALPLALSLLAHAGLIGLLWLFSGHLLPGPQVRSGEEGPTLSIGLTSIVRSRPAAAPVGDDEWAKMGVEPRVILPTARGSDDARIVSAGSVAGAVEEASSGIGEGSAPASAPPGSAVLPVPPRMQRVIYLLDRSVSMGPSGALGRARRELALSLRALPAGTLFQVLVYNQVVTPIVPAPAGLARANEAQVTLAIGELDKLACTGKTNHILAIQRALQLRPDILFLLTDADNLLETDVALLTRANTAGTAIHVVELSRVSGERGDGPMARLAAVNGGTCRRIHPER